MRKLTVALALLLTIPLMLGTVVIRRGDVFSNDEVCPECTIWMNFNDCADTSPPDSNDSSGNGICDDSDSPMYTLDTDGPNEFTADSTKTLTDNNDPKIDNDAPDYMNGDSWGVTVVNTGGGDYFVADSDNGSTVDRIQGRCAMAIQWGTGAFSHSETHLSSSVSGGTRIYISNQATGNEGFTANYDYGASFYSCSGSTTTLADNQWHFVEMAWCDDSATSCDIALGDDSIELFVNGSSECSATNASHAPQADSASSKLYVGRDTGGGNADFDIGWVICTDDETVDLWDRYAGRCTDGTTRCIDNSPCGGGTCDNPEPNINYPGAS